MYNRKPKSKARLGIVVLALLAMLGSASEAQIILQDLNSTISVNPATPGRPMMDLWDVNGVPQLSPVGGVDYYFRVGSAGPEAQLNTLPLVGAVPSDTNPFTDLRPDTASMLYRTGLFDAELKVSLQGAAGASKWSDVAHQLRISNTGNEALDFHLFQYANFDLGGTPLDTGIIYSPDEVLQSDASGAWQVSVSEIVTPDASHWEISNFPNLLQKLQDPLTTVLNDSTGPISGDVEYGFQWDIVIQPGDSFILSKDMLIIPEPSSIALLGVISGVGLFVRRRFLI